MLILIPLLALAIWAIVHTIIVMRRDGYGRCNTVEAGLRQAPRNSLEMGQQWRGW
ncbi:MAG: hypothetical protein ABWX62_07580 [Microterricola sp.]